MRQVLRNTRRKAKRSRPRDRDRKGLSMPLAARLGRRPERRNPRGSDIRKPGDLPAIKLKRTDGVFRDLRMWARVARPAGYAPFKTEG